MGRHCVAEGGRPARAARRYRPAAQRAPAAAMPAATSHMVLTVLIPAQPIQSGKYRTRALRMLMKLATVSAATQRRMKRAMPPNTAGNRAASAAITPRNGIWMTARGTDAD